VVQQLQGSQQVIVIESANPYLVYVPSYNPAVIYAGPPAGAAIGGLITFGAGIAIGACFGGGNPWGWGDLGLELGPPNVIVDPMCGSSTTAIVRAIRAIVRAITAIVRGPYATRAVPVIAAFGDVPAVVRATTTAPAQ
jgi:hypothetical protein